MHADPDEEGLRQRFYSWHLANLEFANAANVGELSVRTWDQDDPHELSGPHCFLPGPDLNLRTCVFVPSQAASSPPLSQADHQCARQL